MKSKLVKQESISTKKLWSYNVHTEVLPESTLSISLYTGMAALPTSCSLLERNYISCIIMELPGLMSHSALVSLGPGANAVLVVLGNIKIMWSLLKF